MAKRFSISPLCRPVLEEMVDQARFDCRGEAPRLYNALDEGIYAEVVGFLRIFHSSRFSGSPDRFRSIL